VIISAALSARGAPAQVLHQVLLRGRLVMSPPTFAELESRLWKPKFDRYLSVDLRKRLLHDLNAAAHWVDLTEPVTASTHSRDVDDDKFIHTALTAGAPWLVSGDRDLLDLVPPPGLQIVDPAEMLRRLAAGGVVDPV
jgi:putative PIN family toxin of toxin-antitoxin system